MSNKQKILDSIVVEKNKLVSKMSPQEKKDADMYFEEVIQELMPTLNALEVLSKNEKVKDKISNSFKEEVKEQKWLEKLSEVFYLLERSQKKTQEQQ